MFKKRREQHTHAHTQKEKLYNQEHNTIQKTLENKEPSTHGDQNRRQLQKRKAIRFKRNHQKQVNKRKTSTHGDQPQLKPKHQN